MWFLEVNPIAIIERELYPKVTSSCLVYVFYLLRESTHIDSVWVEDYLCFVP